jgi:tryptophan 2,3-dioxygenase
MVERIIGRRIGTGGSSGVDYLDQTLKYRIFSELWSVRTMLLPQDELPTLKQEQLYDFATKFD